MDLLKTRLRQAAARLTPDARKWQSAYWAFMLGKASLGEDGRVLEFPSKHRNKQLALGTTEQALNFGEVHACHEGCMLSDLPK